MLYHWSFSEPLYLNGNVKPAKQPWQISLRREGDFKKAVVFSVSGSLSGAFLLSYDRGRQSGEQIERQG